MVMNTLTFDKLPEAVQTLQEQISEIHRLLAEEKPSKSDRLMVLPETAKFLNLSKASVYRLVSHRQIPFHKSGGKLYFFEEEVRDWVKDGRQ